MEVSKENTETIIKNMRSETTKINSRCEYIELMQERIDKLEKTLKSANELCRSTMQVVKRKGKNTEWLMLEKWLENSLALQQSVLYPKKD